MWEVWCGNGERVVKMVIGKEWWWERGDGSDGKGVVVVMVKV